MSYVDKLTEAEKAKYSTLKKWDSRLLSYNKTIVNDNIVIQGNVSKELILVDCYIQGNLEFINCDFDVVNIENCFIDGSINLSGDVKIKQWVLNDIKIKGNVTLKSGVYESILCHIDEVSNITLSGGEFSNLYISCTSAVNFEVNLFLTKGNIEFGYGTFNELNIYGANPNSSISVYDIDVKLLLINDYRNEKGFRLLDINPIDDTSTFQIKNSYLGKAEFYNIDLSLFSDVVITNTHLTDCSFVNIRWIDVLSHEAGDEDAILDTRETYRQLKYALGKQGDTVNEQKFHTLEMLAHHKILYWDTDFWTKLIIKLSYITSNFGQSIWWPIRALFIVHSLLFLFAMLTGLSSIHISFTNASWSAFNTAVYEYFYLINPLHRTEDLPKDWTIIIDIFMRIWSSYMIYNIIRASRRFIK